MRHARDIKKNRKMKEKKRVTNNSKIFKIRKKKSNNYIHASHSFLDDYPYYNDDAKF